MFLEVLYEYAGPVTVDGLKLILAWEFELRPIDWDCMRSSSVKCSHSDILLNIAFSYDLVRLVPLLTGFDTTTAFFLYLLFIIPPMHHYDLEILEGVSNQRFLCFTCILTACVEKTDKKCVVSDFINASDVDILDFVMFSLLPQ